MVVVMQLATGETARLRRWVGMQRQGPRRKGVL
jgi:hypothetical protein